MSRRLYMPCLAAICAASSFTVVLLFAGIAAACSGGAGGCGLEKPSVTTEAATSIKASSAVLHGQVNPHGCLTNYEFEWGTKKESFEFAVGFSAGTGTSNVPEEQFISTSPNTTYFFRISATNINGEARGSELSFKSLPKSPSVTTGSATEIKETSAKLNATVNPNGAATTYYFRYGPNKSVEQKTKEESAGSGTEGVSVGQTVTGLEPGTEYFFRIVAANSGGSSEGTNGTFTTSSQKWETQIAAKPVGAKSSRLAFGSCTEAKACTSVGEYVNSGGTTVPLAERWNGSTWAVQTAPAPTGATWSELLGVSCTTSTACAAAGLYESGGVRHGFAEGWNGTEWTVQTTPDPAEAKSAEISAISCTSSTACTAVGHYTTSTTSVTLAERWNGISWTVQSTPNPKEAKESALLGVSCTSSTACTATGYYYNSLGTRLTLAETWNGTSWSVQTTPNRSEATGNILLGVSCTSSSACTAVGADFPSVGAQETLVEHWNGSEWSIQTSQNPSGSGASVLHGSSCVSASLCMAVGDYIKEGVNVTLAERWNGSSWTLQSTPNPSEAKFSALWSVACTSVTECVAPGYYKDSTGTEWALIEKLS